MSIRSRSAPWFRAPLERYHAAVAAHDDARAQILHGSIVRTMHGCHFCGRWSEVEFSCGCVQFPLHL